MKVVFCGGGTAGHVTPAIAMREIIDRNFKDSDFIFIGRQGGDENKAILKEGGRLYTLDVMGLRRSLSPKNISAVFKLIKAYRKAKRLLREYRPDIVIGTGGYVSYPVILAAQRMKIKTMIHESNAYPGLVTRSLGKKCDKLLLNLGAAKDHLAFSDNIDIIGNPLPKGYSAITRSEARRQLGLNNGDFFILSFGGSLGSEKLNEVMIEVMKKYSVRSPHIKHIHGCGRSHFDKIKEADPQLCHGINGCKIVPYIEKMPMYLNASDIAITRSGAMTISELASAAAAAILVPSPNVVANHQYMNAKFISDSNGAVLIEEDALTSDTLIKEIARIKSNASLRDELRKSISAFSPTRAEEGLINAIRSVF